jgi:hypothetical protein
LHYILETVHNLIEQVALHWELSIIHSHQLR